MATYFCSACKENVEAEVDEAEGHSFCALCGLQLDDLHFESGPTFARTGDTAHLAGTIIRDADLARAGGGVAGRYRDDSQARSVDKGKHWIRNFAHQLQVPEANTYIEQATRMYGLATSNGFTRGRRTNQVAAACLYIVLRQDRRPYMLIDFCHLLSVNVYVLGSTYIRLTERLRLDTHPVLVCAVDPSLFLHRFAGKLALPAGTLEEVVQTAMLLIAQMKRDWMQTGRRPAGVCGAALWLACHIHGVAASRKDVIRVVSIGESTMMHRISELRNTAAGDMTLAEYKAHAKACLAHQRDLEANRLAQVRGDVSPGLRALCWVWRAAGVTGAGARAGGGRRTAERRGRVGRVLPARGNQGAGGVCVRHVPGVLHVVHPGERRHRARRRRPPRLHPQPPPVRRPPFHSLAPHFYAESTRHADGAAAWLQGPEGHEPRRA